MNFGSFLRGRRAKTDENVIGTKKDKAIIHTSVPEEVLRTESDPIAPPDVSWMDEVRIADEPDPDSVAVEPPKETSEVVATPAPVEPAREEVPEEPAEIVKEPEISVAANAPATSNHDRPRFPCGWLVVVEGPGVGEWFVLERGVSHIGRDEGQTVRLNFGDEKVRAERHAVLTYDEDKNAFVLGGKASAGTRLNGQVMTNAAVLRDGDVFSVGGTSLRLAALCTPNFNWNGQQR